ncbi:cupin domain protein [Paecilomyces variotii No. 5]|uniref:Cupin domain protein n=1 Tax=Byssochlamys spectabilis (strain No. 5 / NBRC 109023) TaxID=1356009 RepID=V5I040_BYSSN|nr:cupin domain protein [Paecilomyces variotii No. 5]
MSTASNLPLIHRYITTHNTEGEAIFVSTSQFPECIPARPADEDGDLALLYATATCPVQAHDEYDVSLYDEYLHTPQGLVPPTGSVIRMIDLRPGKISPMHRTVSLDYGVLLEGEVDLILDSGQSRRMRRGDVSIQRGTAHSYRNRSQTEWVRMLFVFLPMEPVTIAGKTLGAEVYDEPYELGKQK